MPESLIKLQASGLGLRTLLFTEDLWWLLLKFIQMFFVHKKNKKKTKKNLEDIIILQSMSIKKVQKESLDSKTTTILI